MFSKPKYLFKFGMLLLVYIFLFCSKNSTEPNDEIVKPEILYISQYEVPIAENGYQINRALTIIDANGNNRRNIYTVNRGNLIYTNYSAVTKKIVFTMFSDTTGKSALYLIDVYGKNLLQISDELSNEFSTAFISPQFLSDGIHIIYIRRIDWDKYEIRKINSETREDVLIFDGDFGGVPPFITMNDELFFSFEESIYKISSNGGTIEKIPTRCEKSSVYYLNQQTNELLISCYHSDKGSYKIAKILIDGSGFIEYDFRGQSPRLSSDGGKIIYLAMGTNDPSIWITNSDGSDSHVLTSHFTWDQYCQFFPDDNRILFVREVNDYYAIYSCDIDGNRIKRLSKTDFFQSWPIFIP